MRIRQLLTAARNDVNLFAALCFTGPDGQPLVPAPVHRELQAFLSAYPRALVELPRDHGKSVQACIRVLWELGRQPGLRIKIVCATEAIASERGQFLRDAIAFNPRLRLVFPHLRPAKPWDALRFTVARPPSLIGPSVAIFGLGSGSTGARADLLLCDDIVDVRAIRSAADRERANAYFRENLVNLLEPDGRLWYLFTPWHRDDLGSRLKADGVYPHFRRAIPDDLTPVWPGKWPRERLLERRREIGEIAFARGYRLICVAEEEVPIRAGWVQFWAEPAPPDCVVLAVDPAVSSRASADRSALVTLARTATNEIRCLEALARRVPAPELVQLIDEADRRWRPDAILFEANAAFAAVRDLLVRHARFGPKIRGIVQSRDKRARIEAFAIPVANGSFRLQAAPGGEVHPAQSELFDEMTTFPMASNDDLVDAAAFGTDWLLNRPEPRFW